MEGRNTIFGKSLEIISYNYYIDSFCSDYKQYKNKEYISGQVLYISKAYIHGNKENGTKTNGRTILFET